MSERVRRCSWLLLVGAMAAQGCGGGSSATGDGRDGLGDGGALDGSALGFSQTSGDNDGSSIDPTSDETPQNDAIIASTAYTLSGQRLTLSDAACTAFRDAVASNGAASVRIAVPCALPGDGDGGTCKPADEICNGVDDNCDGEVDEGCIIIVE